MNDPTRNRVALVVGQTGQTGQTGQKWQNVRALCLALAEKGCGVAFACGGGTGGLEELAALMGEIEAKGVRTTSSLVPGYTSEKLSAAIVDTAEKMGGIDILVYMGEPPESYEPEGKLLLDLDEYDWDIAMNPIAKGFFLSCKYALPYLINGINAKVAAVGSNPCGECAATVFASLAALKTLAKHLESELSHYGVSVTYIPEQDEHGKWIEKITG